MAFENLEDRYIRLQGDVYWANIDPSDGLPLGLNKFGNVKDGNFALTTQSIKHNESRSGKSKVDAKIETAQEGMLTLMLDSFQVENLRIAAFGTVSTQAAGTVTNESLKAFLGKSNQLKSTNLASFASLTLGGGTGATATVALVSGRLVFTVTAGGSNYASAPVITVTGGTGGAGATFIGTVVGGVITAITQNAGGSSFTAVPTAVVITAIAAATLVNGADYRINIKSGFIEFASTPATAALVDGIGLLANYVCGVAKTIDAFKGINTPLYIVSEGKNTNEGDAPVICKFFKVRFDPLTSFKIISNEFEMMEIKGEILNQGKINPDTNDEFGFMTWTYTATVN